MIMLTICVNRHAVAILCVAFNSFVFCFHIKQASMLVFSFEVIIELLCG